MLMAMQGICLFKEGTKAMKARLSCGGGIESNVF